VDGAVVVGSVRGSVHAIWRNTDKVLSVSGISRRPETVEAVAPEKADPSTSLALLRSGRDDNVLSWFDAMLRSYSGSAMNRYPTPRTVSK
jgi:hypothetical protein